MPTPTDAHGPLPPHADPPPARRLLRSIERLLLVVAMVTLGYFAYVSVEARVYQARENRALDEILASAPPPPANRQPATSLARASAVSGGTVGRIEIPRLGISAVVRAGDDASTLRLAVGHIPGTAFPGEPGNVGLAAHRDTFFSKLGRIAPDDEVRVVTQDGTFVYRVERTNVVEPTDVWVLDPTPAPSLTLVTCYPFTFIGSAPQRFIVRAVLADPAAPASPERPAPARYD